jgi:hypothetical protein
MGAWRLTRRMSKGAACALVLLVVATALLLQACGGSGKPAANSSEQDPCISPGQLGGATPEDLLTCDKFTQPLYWLGRVLQVPGLPEIKLSSSYTTNDERPITSDTRLALEYAPDPTRPAIRAVATFEWGRPAWEAHVASFTGYDYTTVPAQGPVNWWQHPCVEEEVYHAANGAEVHLFRSHLTDLIRILPMTADEVAHCLSQPVSLINAHVYFERTVVQMDVALQQGNPYDSEENVRYLVDSLRPYSTQ